jgi:tRNA threonylcarbamoyladenosine biosynthesis protein TsaE
MSDAFATPLRLTLSTEDELHALAARFASRLRPGDVVALSGPLGSGKTAFVRAIVRALHGVEQGSSPTFTFWHHYGGEPPIEHIDLFRIEDPRELTELGLEEALDGRSIVLVEWWRNAPDLLPPKRYEVEIDGAGEGPRTIDIRESQ